MCFRTHAEHLALCMICSFFLWSYFINPIFHIDVVQSSKLGVPGPVPLLVRIFIQKHFPSVVKFMKVTSTMTGFPVVTLHRIDC